METKQQNPLQKRAIVTREKILKAGEYLFSHKGYFQTNLRDIVKQADVAIGSFYVYFKNKKEVLIETLERHNKEIIQQLNTYIEEEDMSAYDRTVYVLKLIDAVIKAHRILPDYHKEIVFLMHTDTDIKKMMKAYTNEAIGITYRMLLKNKSMLKVKDLRTAAEIVTIFTEEIVHRIVFNSKKNKQNKIIEEATTMISGYLFSAVSGQSKQ